MKVCHVVSTFPRFEGDAEVPWLLELLKRQKSAGIDVSVFAPSFKGLRSHEICGIRVRRFRYFFRRLETLTHEEGATNKMPGLLLLLMPIFYLGAGIPAFISHCRRERFDLIHVHWAMPHGLFALVTKVALRLPYLCTFYTAEIALLKRFPFLKPILRIIARSSDGLISISSYARDELKKTVGLDSKIIPYGASLPTKPFARETKGSAKRTYLLLFVGRLIERKGLEYLIMALPKVLASFDVRLRVIGRGRELPRLKELVRRVGLHDKVDFLGIVSASELQESYAQADLFVLPAIVDKKGDTEGLGVVLVEALSFGLPVVTTNVGGIKDVIEDGNTGFVAREKDPEDLAAKICLALSNYDFALETARRGFERAKSIFSWDKIVREISSVYSQCMSSKVELSASVN